jgi:predicted Rossmann fold flavoprotein
VQSTYDVVVLGGGAAGLMCAIEAGKRGRRVILLERNAEVGRKILISGGGRCNFTNVGAGPEHFFSENPDFCRSALARYRPADFVALVEKHGIAYHEKKLGQLFCDGSARQVVDLLLAEARGAGVRIETGCAVERVDAGAGFALATSRGGFRAVSLVVATGGLSIPKLGATDLAQCLAAQFGVAVTETRPGLVPLRMAGEMLGFCADLAGVSLRTETRCAGAAFQENVLFTHRGVSGPAVLQASNVWRPGLALELDLLPGEDATALLEEARAHGRGLVRLLEARQPRRFAQAFAARSGAAGRPLAELTRSELDALARSLSAWRLEPSETEGYQKAEVTVGGVDTRELSSRTMECRRVPGLYFVGEAVDVTGWLGGYNFQWAWASGYAAGQAA